MLFKKILLALLLIFLTPLSFATDKPIIPLQATSCIKSTFTNTGNQWWKTMSLTLKNECGKIANFQNTTITFLNKKDLNVGFWGKDSFSPLGYPKNTHLTSELQSDGLYLSTIVLQFSEHANTILKNNESITILYGAPTADYIADSVNVNLGTPVNGGTLSLSNQTSKPDHVSETYSLVNLNFNGQLLSSVKVPWGKSIQIPHLAEGNYGISPVNVTDSGGNVYQGTADPSSITLVEKQTAFSRISYAIITVDAKISFKTENLPSQISGYTENPAITLTNTNNSSVTNSTLNWNTTTTVASLVNNNSYRFSAPSIAYNGYKCTPEFNPSSATAGSTAPIVSLKYLCTHVATDNVHIKVTGLPSSVTSITATFTPNDGSTAISKNIDVANGQGSSGLTLTDKVTYTVSSTEVNGYTTTYLPQPFIAAPNATETISYAAAGTTAQGRIIGYLPGWKKPPSANELSSAGYTHILVAFGVFSTSNPGQITPAFATVTASDIKSLQNAGIKVILSLGGALTSIPNTTVSFHDALVAAASPEVFTQTFIESMETLMTQYGFDGFDIDIEHGLGDTVGTFTNPKGDVGVMANILNTMHAKHPSVLLTMAPQTANVSPNRAYDQTWGNYAALIMQTYNSLEWVGIQLYNSGCMNGIDNVCYDPNETSSPNFSVALATGLLANWPTPTFMPYISYLKPSQVVLGYLIPNANGVGDGGPVIPVSTIKRAVQCLRTADASSCGTYVPPKAYPGIGGVFGWEVTYDQNNSYKFSKGLVNCVVNGNCQ